MHPEMKHAIDQIVLEATAQHAVPRIVVETQVNHCLIISKLHILGANVKDKKIDVKDSTDKIAEEVTNLAYQVCSANGIEHAKLMELGEDIVKRLTPLIHQYFLGLAPGRKPS